MNVKQGKSVIWLFLKILLWVTISVKISWRDLFIDMVVDRFVCKNNQIVLFPCLTFILKAGLGLPKTYLIIKNKQRNNKTTQKRKGKTAFLPHRWGNKTFIEGYTWKWSCSVVNIAKIHHPVKVDIPIELILVNGARFVTRVIHSAQPTLIHSEKSQLAFLQSDSVSSSFPEVIFLENYGQLGLKRWDYSSAGGIEKIDGYWIACVRLRGHPYITSSVEDIGNDTWEDIGLPNGGPDNDGNRGRNLLGQDTVSPGTYGQWSLFKYRYSTSFK